MNRKYTREWYLDRIAAIRRYLPDCADYDRPDRRILGRDGGGARCDALSLMREVGYEFAYMFKYSERPGTYAAQAPGRRRARRGEVGAAGRNHRPAERTEPREQPARRGPRVRSAGRGRRPSATRTSCSGRTSQNKVVVFDRGGHGVGDYVRVRITGCTPATLFGECTFPERALKLKDYELKMLFYAFRRTRPGG